MDWFITGDYTYWTAREKGLEYAVSVATQEVNPEQGVAQGQIYRLGNKWASGFKVGLGTDFCHDGWDLYAEYTWFKKTENSHTPDDFTTERGRPAGVLALQDGFWDVNATIISPDGSDRYSGASAQWRLNMNVVDLELGRNFYVSPRLMLRPFYGLKGAWNKQHIDVSFTGTMNGAGTFPITIINSMTNKIKNWGIGVRAGMDTSWHFSRNFSIIGDMAFTGLWEEFKIKRFDTRTDIATNIVTGSNVNLKESQYTVEPVIEWMLGLKWETGFSCDAYHLAITAAWEEQVWFEQNNFLRIPGSASVSGDSLSLQGLTVDVRFDF